MKPKMRYAKNSGTTQMKIAVALFFGFLCIACKEKHSLVASSNALVSDQAKVPIVVLHEMSPNNTILRNEWKVEETSEQFIEYIQNSNGFQIEYVSYYKDIKDYAIEDWQHSFDLAKKRIKLLAPAIYSDFDKLFIKSKFGEFTSFLLIDENKSNIRGIVMNHEIGSKPIYFTCTKLTENADYNMIFSMVFSFMRSLQGQ